MQTFLALPIEEKATHAARALAKLKNELVGELEEEGEEGIVKEKSLKQIKSKAALPKQIPNAHELKITTMKGGKAMKGGGVQPFQNVNDLWIYLSAPMLKLYKKP